MNFSLTSRIFAHLKEHNENSLLGQNFKGSDFRHMNI